MSCNVCMWWWGGEFTTWKKGMLLYHFSFKDDLLIGEAIWGLTWFTADSVLTQRTEFGTSQKKTNILKHSYTASPSLLSQCASFLRNRDKTFSIPVFFCWLEQFLCFYYNTRKCRRMNKNGSDTRGQIRPSNTLYKINWQVFLFLTTICACNWLCSWSPTHAYMSWDMCSWYM